MIWIAPTGKDVLTTTLEKRLWDSADQFRASCGLKAQEYSGPILGIIFLHFAEVRFALQRAMPEHLIRLNQTRANSAETFEELIESHNAGSRNIEELFQELLELSRSRSEEHERHVRENMTEEERVIFDILTRPAPELSTAERAEVKKVACELLARLKSLLVLNWRQKAGARAQLKLAIEDVLDAGLPRAYDKRLYEQTCSAFLEHIFESYPERDRGVYASAA